MHCGRPAKLRNQYRTTSSLSACPFIRQNSAVRCLLSSNLVVRVNSKFVPVIVIKAYGRIKVYDCTLSRNQHDMKKNLHLHAQTASQSEKVFPLPFPIKWDGVRTDMDALE
jgi:hypothetical protein